jgi:hypothetical protein
MAHGGPRNGAGRKPGQATKLNQQAREQALEGGISPLDYMLSILRDETVDKAERMDAAKAAAPYVHARLSSAEVKSDVTHNFVARVPNKAADSTTWQQQHTPGQSLQ